MTPNDQPTPVFLNPHSILSLLHNKLRQARATGVKRTWRDLSDMAARLKNKELKVHKNIQSPFQTSNFTCTQLNFYFSRLK